VVYKKLLGFYVCTIMNGTINKRHMVYRVFEPSFQNFLKHLGIQYWSVHQI